MTDATIEHGPTPAHIGASPDKREAILAAALRLIARLGLHAAPMSAVAREAGVAAGTLYLYFPSKEAMINALYLEVLEDRDRSMLAEVAVARERGGGRTRGAVGVLAWPRPMAPRPPRRVELPPSVQVVGDPHRRDAGRSSAGSTAKGW